MKLYYCEDDLYPATHNFEDEVDGTSGTDIAFIDSVVLYNGAIEIVSDWQSHRKVLRFQDDITVGEDPTINHNETQATAGTREFWLGTNDVTEDWQLRFYETGNDYINILRITTSNLYYKDNAEAWQVIQAVANNILYHLKIVWRADNTFDVYVGGIKQVDNVANNNNQVSGVNLFSIKAFGDSEDYLYLDAYGDPTNDTDYDVGDNLKVDWHDPYNKVEITDIIAYPDIDSILDMTTGCGCSIRIDPDDSTTLYLSLIHI